MRETHEDQTPYHSDFNEDQPVIATEKLTGLEKAIADTHKSAINSEERKLVQWYIKARRCACKIQSGPQFGLCRPIDGACGPSVCPWVYWR